MNYRHIIGAALLASSAAAPAYAQDSDTADVTIDASVASLCVLGAPSRAAVDLGQIASTSGSRVGRITTVGNQLVTLPGSFCNFAGTALTVSASALLADDTSSVQPGFARAVNYTSTVSNWAASPAQVTTAAAAGGGTPSAQGSGGIQNAPKLADLTLTLSSFTVPSDLLLLSGGYRGSVTITLAPAVIAE
jgi:hypothetical protein